MSVQMSKRCQIVKKMSKYPKDVQKMSKRCQIVKMMSNAKSCTEEEVHKKNFTHNEAHQ